MQALRWIAIAAALVYAGCGEDEEEGTTAPQGQATRAAPEAGGAPGAGAGSGKQLSPQVHIEDRVACRPPVADPAKKCDPAAPSCKENEYCLGPYAQGSFCGPCPERDGIRHAFKARDFAPGDNRDPFESLLVKQFGSSSGQDPALVRDPTQRCVKKDQLRATGVSYLDLRLVGIVAQGTERRVLMIDPSGPFGPYGEIIKRGDCVGKEKAIVKDIGTGYVTFEIPQDVSPTGQAREPEQRSVQLHPKQIPVSMTGEMSMVPASRTTITPVVAPPPSLNGQGPAASEPRPSEPRPQPPEPSAPTPPPAEAAPTTAPATSPTGSAGGAGATGGTRTIIIPPQPAAAPSQPQAPKQAPTDLNP